MNTRELLKELKFNGVNKLFVRKDSLIHQGIKEVVDLGVDELVKIKLTDGSNKSGFRLLGMDIIVE